MSVQSKPPWRPQITLGDLLLLIAVMATAMAWYQTRNRLAEESASLQSMQILARELQIEDPDKIAIITRQPTRPNETIHDVYIPEGYANEPGLALNLVLEDIVRKWEEEDLRPAPQLTHPLPPGRHSIEVRHIEPVGESPDAEHTIEILLDDVVVISTNREREWMATRGWTGSGTITQSRSFEPDQPVEILRRRFHEKTATGTRSADADQPANGILLWIE